MWGSLKEYQSIQKLFCIFKIDTITECLCTAHNKKRKCHFLYFETDLNPDRHHTYQYLFVYSGLHEFKCVSEKLDGTMFHSFSQTDWSPNPKRLNPSNNSCIDQQN